MTTTVKSSSGESSARQTNREVWAWWGAAAGGLGVVAHLLTQPEITIEQRRSGTAVLGALDRTGYHIGAVAGFMAVACLLITAAGWRRWADRLATENLGGRLVPLALTASAGAMVIAYGVKGALAIYLPRGINDGEFPPEGLYTLFMIDDLAPFYAWWGVAVAAAGVAWLGLRHHLLPRWIGALSAIAFLLPTAFLTVTGLTGFAGAPGPVWLLVASIGVARLRVPAPADG